MHRWHMKGGILNPASMKQALVEGAVRIPGINLYEQGAGKMNLLNSMVQSPPLFPLWMLLTTLFFILTCMPCSVRLPR